MKRINKKYLNVKARRRYYLRFFCSTIILTILIVLFKCLFSVSFSFLENEIVTYKETGDVDYKIYLKENDFYDKPYLEKNMAYIASLIDNVNIDFNYKFNVDRKSDLNVKYSIIGNLVIESQTNSNTFFEKKYVLQEDKTLDLKNEDNFSVSENIVIDYAKYNNLVNKFRTNYAVSTTSYLDVYLQVEEINKDTNSYRIVNVSKTSLKIPLSQQEINININDQKLDNEKKIITTSKYVVKNKLYMLISMIILFILFIYTIKYIFKTIKLFKIISLKDTKYDKYINKLLKCYDRIIVNVRTVVDFDDYNMINVVNFQELVDVRDNVKEPINYYIIEEHESCIFFIIHNNDLYLYSISSSDFDEEQ